LWLAELPAVARYESDEVEEIARQAFVGPQAGFLYLALLRQEAEALVGGHHEAIPRVSDARAARDPAGRSGGRTNRRSGSAPGPPDKVTLVPRNPYLTTPRR